MCVCSGAHVQVCFTVCIYAVGFCAHTSVVLYRAVDVCYGACDPAVLGVGGGYTNSHQGLSRSQDSTPCPPNSQRWRLGLSLKPQHLSHRMGKANCPANSCSLSYNSLRPLEEEPGSRCAETPAKSFSFGICLGLGPRRRGYFLPGSRGEDQLSHTQPHQLCLSCRSLDNLQVSSLCHKDTLDAVMRPLSGQQKAH